MVAAQQRWQSPDQAAASGAVRGAGRRGRGGSSTVALSARQASASASRQPATAAKPAYGVGQLNRHRRIAQASMLADGESPWHDLEPLAGASGPMLKCQNLGKGSIVKTSAVIILLLSTSLVYGQQSHRCSAHAIQQAKALLVFHTGADSNIGVDDSCKVLAPLRNTVNPRQSFDVLEVQGYVYRANYRMRLIYAQIPRTCTLIGQEIIERSSP